MLNPTHSLTFEILLHYSTKIYLLGDFARPSDIPAGWGKCHLCLWAL